MDSNSKEKKKEDSKQGSNNEKRNTRGYQKFEDEDIMRDTEEFNSQEEGDPQNNQQENQNNSNQFGQNISSIKS